MTEMFEVDDDGRVWDTPILTEPFSISFEFEGVSLEAMAALTGWPLVDLSIMYDTHIIRGEE